MTMEAERFHISHSTPIIGGQVLCGFR